VSDWSDELDPSGSVEMLVARVVGYDKVCLESGREAHLGTYLEGVPKAGKRMGRAAPRIPETRVDSA
jgi:hypothetical protein